MWVGWSAALPILGSYQSLTRAWKTRIPSHTVMWCRRPFLSPIGQITCKNSRSFITDSLDMLFHNRIVENCGNRKIVDCWLYPGKLVLLGTISVLKFQHRFIAFFWWCGSPFASIDMAAPYTLMLGQRRRTPIVRRILICEMRVERANLHFFHCTHHNIRYRW